MIYDFGICKSCSNEASIKHGLCLRCKWKQRSILEELCEVEENNQKQITPKKVSKQKVSKQIDKLKKPDLVIKKFTVKTEKPLIIRALKKASDPTIREKVLEFLKQSGRPHTSAEIIHILDLNQHSFECEISTLCKSGKIYRQLFTGIVQGVSVKCLPSYWIHRFKIIPEPCLRMMKILEQKCCTTPELCTLLGVQETTIRGYWRQYSDFIGRNKANTPGGRMTYYLRKNKQIPKQSDNGLTYLSLSVKVKSE